MFLEGYEIPDLKLAQDGIESQFNDASYQGRADRFMYDRRTGFETVNCHLFLTQFMDEDKTVEIQINPEFDVEDATHYAEMYGFWIGRIPKDLRTKVETVWIHDGMNAFGGGNNNLLIHTTYGEYYLERGWMDSVFLHEATHTSLDPLYLRSDEW